jgi:hypothetical protein
MKRYDGIYHATRMAGEAVLLHPRSQLHQGRYTDALSAFHSVGDRLLDEHVLFDVIPDDIATPETLKQYSRVFTISSASELDQETYSGLSRFEAPKTVRVSSNRPEKGDEIDVHFVNYGRSEPDEKSRKRLIADENPVAVAGIKADVVIPAGFRATKVEMITPEAVEPQTLSIEQQAGRVQFTVPEILVYGVARIHLERSGVAQAAVQLASLFTARIGLNNLLGAPQPERFKRPLQERAATVDSRDGGAAADSTKTTNLNSVAFAAAGESLVDPPPLHDHGHCLDVVAGHSDAPKETPRPSLH